MLTLARDFNRQDRLWLPGLVVPTVLAVDDQQRAFKRAFASTLVVLRGDSGLGSQGNVAAKVPTSEATYRRWESLKSPGMPDAWQINRLCDILGCEPDVLVAPKPLSDREVRMAQRLGRLRQASVEAAQVDEADEIAQLLARPAPAQPNIRLARTRTRLKQ